MLHLRQNNLHIPIIITLLLLHQIHRHPVFQQGRPRTWFGAFRWWIGTEVASLMNVNCSKLSLLDSTTSTLGPFVFSCSSSRIHTNPSQLVPNFCSNFIYLFIYLLGWSVPLCWFQLPVACAFTGPKEFAALWSCLGHWRVSFFFISSFILSQHNHVSCSMHWKIKWMELYFIS